MSTATSTAIIPASDNAVYMVPSGELQLDVRIDSDTAWLTQAQIAELFEVRVPTINEHLRNIYEQGELERRATIRNFRIVRQEGLHRRQQAHRQPAVRTFPRQERLPVAAGRQPSF
jgi:hypothetical protein